jgi:hypothetical protein
MKTQDIAWINQILVNDEVSSDIELVALFAAELGISQEQAAHITSYRTTALLDGMSFDIADCIK